MVDDPGPAYRLRQLIPDKVQMNFPRILVGVGKVLERNPIIAHQFMLHVPSLVNIVEINVIEGLRHDLDLVG